MMHSLDLLNDPVPDDWHSTRHCPSCGCVDLVISSDPVLLGGWCTTACANCGRELRIDTLDEHGLHTWEDSEWARAGEH